MPTNTIQAVRLESDISLKSNISLRKFWDVYLITDRPFDRNYLVDGKNGTQAICIYTDLQIWTGVDLKTAMINLKPEYTQTIGGGEGGGG